MKNLFDIVGVWVYICFQREEENPMKKNRCPECGGTQVMYRIRKDEFICRSCGTTWKKGLKDGKSKV